MTLLLYTLEYALVLLSSFLQSRYQSENDQGHLRLFEKPPSPQLLSFFPSFHIITFTVPQVYLLQYFKDISIFIIILYHCFFPLHTIRFLQQRNTRLLTACPIPRVH